MNLIKPKKLHMGDEVSVVSLSSGILGEDTTSYQREILEKNLKKLGLRIHYTKNSLRGINYIRSHPEKRAEDLIEAFTRKTTKMIWSAIGGEDTIKILPFLNSDDFRTIIKNNPKIFMGFSDTTINHLFLYSCGLTTYYGPALLPDMADPSGEILPYTEHWLAELFCNSENKIIKPSANWYHNRTSFGYDQLNSVLDQESEKHGFEFFGSDGVVEGELLGGCLESLVYGLNEDKKGIFFPSLYIWNKKILFIESSNKKPQIKKFSAMIFELEKFGIYKVIKAIIVGKPCNEECYSEYKKIIYKISRKYSLPVVYNLNFGHSMPRMIIPYGQRILIDFRKKQISYIGNLFKE